MPLELVNITKRFPGVIANDRVSLTLQPGRVLALLGENGAGKSTLISVMYGLYQPDEGELRVAGKAVRFASPSDALGHGIGLVPQHPMLVSRHTVAENLALGLGGGFFPARRIAGRIKELSERYGLAVNPEAVVGQLSPGEKQRVEIVRCLLREAKILILDEPTSVLTPQETQGLFRVMQGLRKAGKALVFISHKLEEVLTIADDITVLRRGAVVGNLRAEEANKSKLAGLMVGRDVDFSRKRQTALRGEVLLNVQNLCALSKRGLPALKNVAFQLHQGEILGVAGVAGNGQSELIETLAGLHTHTGQVLLQGKPLEANPARLFAQGVAHIPEDRIRMGTIPSMSVAENLALRRYDSPPLANGVFCNAPAMRDLAEAQVKAFNVATPSIHTPSRLLSGGNIQKLILARELAERARLILAVHPTYGLDIGATDQVHEVLLEQTKHGAGVLLVSEDLEELLSLCDRVAVLYHGELRGPFEVGAISREDLGVLMTSADGLGSNNPKAVA